MARNYRRVDLAEAYLLKAKGIVEAADTTVPSSAWYALGYLRGLIDDAVACLASPASRGGAEAYDEGITLMEGYVQDKLFEADGRG